MRLRFRILKFNRDSRQYLSLKVEWQDQHQAWRSKVIRSYGLANDEALVQIEGDRSELQRLASDDPAPIPIATLSDAVWAGFLATTQDPLLLPLMLPLAPLAGFRDLVHLGAYVISQGSGNLAQRVAVTQPSMPAEEQAWFRSWLSGHSLEDQATILAYQWRYYPL